MGLGSYSRRGCVLRLPTVAARWQRDGLTGDMVRPCLVGKKKNYGVSHQMCRKEFSDTNKKQITEPKLRDESNNIN
jgi:hypothetical protein